MCSVKSKKRDRGAMLVLMAILILVLIGATALAVDLGQLHVAKQRAQTVCDACARAGAFGIQPGKPTSGNVEAKSAAEDCADANNQSSTRKVLQQGSDTPGVKISFPDAKSIEVDGDIRVSYGFARLLGFNSSRVSAKSVAQISPARRMTAQFVPGGVSEWLVQDSTDPSLSLPKTLVTDRWKNGVWANAGSIRCLDLNGGHNESDYRNQIQGLVQPFSLGKGTEVDCRTQNVAKATADSLNARINGDTWQYNDWTKTYDVQKMAFPATPRLIALPVLSGTDQKTVVGFTGFFVESATYTSVTDPRGDVYERTIITGYFVPGIAGGKSIRWLWPFQQDQPNLIYQVRLTE